MAKLKLTEAQIQMLQTIEEQLPNRKMVRITTEQYNRIFEVQDRNGFEGVKQPKPLQPSSKVTKNFKKHGKNIPDSDIQFEQEDSVIDIMDFAQEVISFLKELLIDPSDDITSKFWRKVGVSKDELIKKMREVGMITSGMVNGRKLIQVRKNGFQENIKKLYNMFVEQQNEVQPEVTQMGDDIEMGESDENNMKTHDDIKRSMSEPFKKKHDQKRSPEQIKKKLADIRAKELARRKKNDLDEDNSERVDQYLNRVGGAGMIPDHKYSEGDKVLVDMGDGTKEKLTIANTSYFKPPKGKFHLTYKMIEYGDRMIFTQDMIIKRLGKLSEMGESNLPMGAEYDSNAPYNEKEPKQGLRADQGDFDLLYSDDKEFALFKGRDDKFYVYYIPSAENDEYAEYADREEIVHGKDEDGFADVELGEWEMDDYIVENYVNDHFSLEDAGKGYADWENGAPISIIDQELKQELMSLADIIKGDNRRKRYVKILNNIPVGETTTAASSGSFVGKMSGDMPIHKGISPKDAISNVKEDDKKKDKSLGLELKYNNIMHPKLGSYFVNDVQDQREDGGEISYIISLKDDKGNISPSNLLYTYDKETGDEKIYFNHDFEKLYDAYELFDEVYNLVFDKIKEILKPQSEVQEQGIQNSGQYATPGFSPSEFMGTKGKKGKAPVNKGVTHKDTMYPKGKFVKENLKLKESNNQTDTAYPEGSFVEFDDCTKLNNNKEAQKGGCSVGAVDNVVKTKKTKGSVVSDDAVYYEIAKKTGRSIKEVKNLIQSIKA